MSVFLLLNMAMQVIGAVDGTRGSEVKAKTEEAEATNAVPASDASPSGFSGNLLVIPMDWSHWVTVKAIAQEIGRRGHRVTVVIPEVSIRMGPGKHYDTVTHPVPYDKAFIEFVMSLNKDPLKQSAQSFTEKISKKFTQFQRIAGLLHSGAEALLFNASLISHLAQQVSANTEVEHNIRIMCKI